MIFNWEPWRDVACFNYGQGSFLLQGAKHKRTRATKFRVTTAKGSLNGAEINSITKENLIAAGLWEAAPEGSKEAT